MKRVAFERFLQRVKMTLGRDMSVLGVLHTGPVIEVRGDRTDVREIDLLLVVRGATDYARRTDWLPDAESVVLAAGFGATRQDVLFSDGRVVRLRVHPSDSLPSGIGPFRVLLDRGGIGRGARALATRRPPDRVPDLPPEPTVAHAVILAWEAWIVRKRGDGAAAELLARAASEASAAVLSDDPAAANRALLLGREAVQSSIQKLAGLLADGHPEAPGPALLRKWIGDPDLSWQPGSSGTGDVTAPPAPPREPEPVPPVEWRREEPGAEPPVEVLRREPEPEPPVEKRRREPVLRRDACPFCGGRLDPPGRLYVKGSLNDIRFLPGLSFTLDLKAKVIARPCPDCGQISLRLQNGE